MTPLRKRMLEDMQLLSLPGKRKADIRQLAVEIINEIMAQLP